VLSGHVVPTEEGVVVVNQDVQLPAGVGLVQRVRLLLAAHCIQEQLREAVHLRAEELSVPEGHRA